MNRLGMLVDVSHASKASMMQAVECSRAPIVATHACCGALRPHPRNLDDAPAGRSASLAAIDRVLQEDSGAEGDPGMSPAIVIERLGHVVYRSATAPAGVRPPCLRARRPG